MHEETSPLQAALESVRMRVEADGLFLVGIAGPPASGKSTLSRLIRERLEGDGISSVIVPMDGFHLDNGLLDEMELRHRKGAPETFDLGGFKILLQRLKRGEDPVFLPVFDRERDLSIAAARRMTPDTQVLIVEGNYLLFDEPGWRDLATCWDISIWIDTPEEEVLRRCIQRWLNHGHDEVAARARAEGNDLPNARRIAARRLPADLSISDPVTPDALSQTAASPSRTKGQLV